MPIVPVQQEKTVAEAALPTARLRGSNVQAPQSLNQRVIQPDNSDAFSKTRQAFSKIAQEKADRANKTALIGAQAAIDGWEIDNLYGKDGAFNTKGSAAFDLPSKVGVNYNELLSNVREGLHNDDQKMAFQEWALGRKVSVRKKLLQHEANEFDRYSRQEAEAGMELTMKRALASGNPADIAEAENSMLGIINSNLTGAPPEFLELQRMKATTQLYKGVIDNMVDSNPVGAKAYFNTYKDKIDPTLHDDIKKKLNTGSVKQDALNRADNILLQHESYEDQIAEARKIKSQKTRDAVMSRIDSNYSRQQRIKSQEAEDLDEQLTEFLESDEPLSFDQLPVSLQLKSTEADERRYKRAFELKSGIAKHDEDETLEFYDDAMTKFEADPASILEVKRTEIMKMKPGKERDNLLKVRREYLTKGYEAPEAGQSEFNEIVTRFSNDVLALNTKSSAGGKTARAFRNAMRLEAQSFEEKNDRKPSYEELEKIADRQIETVTLQEGYIYDVKSKRFQIDAANIKLGTNERDAVIWAMKKSGLALDQITDDGINDSAYRYLKNGGTLDQLVREYKNAR